MPISTHNIREFWTFEAKISIDIRQTWYFFVTFDDFLIRHFKKRKKSCFLNLKKSKIRILEHWLRYNNMHLWLRQFDHNKLVQPADVCGSSNSFSVFITLKHDSLYGACTIELMPRICSKTEFDVIVTVICNHNY